MTSSSERRPATTIVRGPQAAAARPARLHADLRTSPYTRGARLDPRLVDTGLELAVAEAAAVAEEAARTEGWAAGYRRGHEAGLAAALAEAEARAEAAAAAETEARRVRAERVDRALRALAGAADDLAARVAPAAAEIEAVAVRYAVELAEILVGHHLSVAGCPAADALARVLAELPADAPATVRLHPDDVATLLAAGADGTGAEVPATVTLVADPGVPAGGAVAEAGDRLVDARIDHALRRVREVLGG